MSARAGSARQYGRAGFTVVELLVYMVVAVVVIAAVYQLLIGQNRLYMKQRELQDVRGTLRAAGNLLAFELRQASAPSGDLYFITPDSFAVRSIEVTGMICGEHSNRPRYGIWGVSGDTTDLSDDSLLVFAAGNDGTDDDLWKVGGLKKLWTPNGGGVPDCAWGDTIVGKGKGSGKGTGPVNQGTGTPEIVIEPDDPTVMDDVYIGAPVRLFQRVQYGIFQRDGRWWLGRRVGDAADYELLTGPLQPPANSGLAFTYYDADGNELDPPAGQESQVKYVDITLRGESLGKVPQASGGPAVQEDSLTIRVSLRG